MVTMETSNIGTQVIATLIAFMAALNGGFHVGWTSLSLVKLQADDSDLPVTSSQGSWIASIFSAACAFGALGAALVVNKWGRKLSLFSTSVPYALSCILIGAAQSYWWFIIARFIAAIGYGATATISPMYIGTRRSRIASEWNNLSSSISVIIIGIVQFLNGGLSVFTVDLVGRRPCAVR